MVTFCIETENKEKAKIPSKKNGKRERDRAIYERYVFDGWLYRRLANEYNVSVSTCWQTVQRVNKRLVDQFEDDVREFRVQHTLQLRSMIGELRSAWEQSKAETVTEKTGTGLKGNPIEEQTVKSSSGDPRYLDSAARLLKDIRDIWGADAPKKSTLTDATGQSAPMIEVVIGNRNVP
jgi:hypothetical protein